MTSPSTRLRDLFQGRQRRRNAAALLRFLLAVITIVTLDTVLFQVVMERFEGQSHSWITGVYWTLTTMTTLGLGDIVFVSDTGRLFTSFVLVSGIVLFLVLLPFAFIRYFYAPWLETRRVPARMAGHVVVTSFDNIALPLIEKLELHGISYYVVEPDALRASQMDGDGVSVVTGAIDDAATYERLRVATAKLVVANNSDTVNTSVTLTVRDIAPSVPITALADSTAAVEILELAGATFVLPLKQHLGERLANRLNAGHAQTHIIGSFRDLLLAEFPVYHTPLAGRTIRDLNLRETIGVNIVGVLEHARFVPARPDTRLTDQSIPVVLGTARDILALDEFLVIYDTNYSPVIVIGAGKVGWAATRALERKGVPVHVIDRSEPGSDWIGDAPQRFFLGDAARQDLLVEAGLAQTPGVVITTGDDATNAYLTIHCRRLAPRARIVNRMTHERNMVAMQRAGADIVLSHTSIGVESVFASLRGNELVILGEGVEVHELPLPSSLAGKTLAEAAIASRTGLNVIAIQKEGDLVTNPGGATSMPAASRLLMVGDQSQLKSFIRTYA